MDPMAIPSRAVSFESGYAMRVALEYVELQEAQLSLAKSNARSAALEVYRKIRDPDQGDYETHVAAVEVMFRTTTSQYYAIRRSFTFIWCLRPSSPAIFPRYKFCA